MGLFFFRNNNKLSRKKMYFHCIGFWKTKTLYEKQMNKTVPCFMQQTSLLLSQYKAKGIHYLAPRWQKTESCSLSLASLFLKTKTHSLHVSLFYLMENGTESPNPISLTLLYVKYRYDTKQWWSTLFFPNSAN